MDNQASLHGDGDKGSQDGDGDDNGHIHNDGHMVGSQYEGILPFVDNLYEDSHPSYAADNPFDLDIVFLPYKSPPKSSKIVYVSLFG